MRRLALAALVAAAVVWAPTGSTGDENYVLGYGLHTEGPTKVITVNGVPRTVGPLSTAFSVTKDSMLCAVGEAGGQIAPFNMLVYATKMLTTEVTDNPAGGKDFTVTAEGRSITTVGGIVLEDAYTPLTVTAHDSGEALDGDFFHITIDTSLWPHQAFGKDLDGNPIQPFAGDVAIDTPIAGAPNA